MYLETSVPPKQTSTRIFSVENGILQIHMQPDWQQSFQLLLQLLKFSLNSRYILEMAFEPILHSKKKDLTFLEES